MLEVLAQALERLQLRGDLGQALLRLGHFHRFAAIGEDAFGLFLGGADRGLVDVLGAHRGVGQDGDDLPEQAFYMVGGIEEAIEKAKKLSA